MITNLYKHIIFKVVKWFSSSIFTQIPFLKPNCESKNCIAIGSFRADLSLKSALVQEITLGWKPDRKSGWRAGIENVVDRIIPIVIS